MFDLSHQRLLHAVILSLGIHAVILLGVVSALPIRISVPPATIKAAISSGAASASIPPEVTTSVASSAARALAVRGASARQVLSGSSGHSAPARRPAQGVPMKEKAVVAAGAASEPGAAQTSAPSIAPSTPQDSLSANDLREYRLALAIAARRFKRYPALARERGWAGTVEIALAISAHRPEPDVVLVRSSGHAALDRQAQEMLGQAARATLLPEGLKGRDFRVLLPVQFSLDGDQ